VIDVVCQITIEKNETPGGHDFEPERIVIKGR
jgi:hypothetical protein